MAILWKEWRYDGDSVSGATSYHHSLSLTIVSTQQSNKVKIKKFLWRGEMIFWYIKRCGKALSVLSPEQCVGCQFFVIVYHVVSPEMILFTYTSRNLKNTDRNDVDTNHCQGDNVNSITVLIPHYTILMTLRLERNSLQNRPHCSSPNVLIMHQTIKQIVPPRFSW